MLYQLSYEATDVDNLRDLSYIASILLGAINLRLFVRENYATMEILHWFKGQQRE